jgi:hypothetical protein
MKVYEFRVSGFPAFDTIELSADSVEDAIQQIRETYGILFPKLVSTRCEDCE